MAGTVGFMVEEREEGRPVVVPQQMWGIIMPKGSPITPLLGGHREVEEKHWVPSQTKLT